MAEDTKIEWADHTFNPWIGCTKVSPACDHCYAEAWEARFRKNGWGPHADRVRTVRAYWLGPVRWNKDAAYKGVRRKVFCASLADVFDNHSSIDEAWRSDLWQLIRDTPHLDWLLLTKRPQNIKKYLPGDWGDGYPNVWLGTTVENQPEVDRRLTHLLNIPAKIRFLSCEPLLEDIDLVSACNGFYFFDALRGRRWHDADGGATGSIGRIHWVIAGGESGPNARPTHPGWVRFLQSQCERANVPFFFKQWGEWLPWEPIDMPNWQSQNGRCLDRHILFPADMDSDPKWDDGLWSLTQNCPHSVFQKVGKKYAGRLLDGVIWNQFPAVT